MKLAFISKRREAESAYSFWFKPAGPTKWVAGQSIRLEIDGEERRFSIVSAPFERNIAIATRLSDSRFKQALGSLAPGAEIDGYNIEGDFLWEAEPENHILLASGIGITPYVSMFRQLQHERKPINARLVYADRRDNFIFGDELNRLASKHPELSIDFLPRQRLGQAIIENLQPGLAESTVYVSGPEAMVKDTTSLLITAGLPGAHLKLDLFTGRVGWDG